MKKEIIQSVTRCISSLILLYLSRNETGPWTITILFLVLCNVELTYWVQKLSSLKIMAGKLSGYRGADRRRAPIKQTQFD